METRNIKVTLDKAKEWYHNGNSILKELALQAFTKEELETPTFSEIALMVGEVDATKEECILRILAEYYKSPSNDKFFPNQDKYFIGKNTFGDWIVIKHSSVMYPGLAYYLKEKDAKEALKIFLKEMNYSK